MSRLTTVQDLPSVSQQPISPSPLNLEATVFDFDQWAVEVKRQMIASLKRKGMP